jgi:hypothetical protein
MFLVLAIPQIMLLAFLISMLLVSNPTPEMKEGYTPPLI